MSDLISRQAVIRFIREKVNLSTFMKRSIDKADKACVELCERIAKELPSAERRGSWVGIDDEPCDVWECDRCGHIVERECPPRFCEECGARMEVE